MKSTTMFATDVFMIIIKADSTVIVLMNQRLIETETIGV